MILPFCTCLENKHSCKEERKSSNGVHGIFYLCTSTAQNQGMETILAGDGNGLDTEGKNLPISGKEAYDGVPAAAEVGNITRLEGRKMLQKWDLASPDRKESAKVSGEGILNVSYELRNRNPHRHRHRHRKTKATAGFAAFSADYHVPKPHPPKNN